MSHKTKARFLISSSLILGLSVAWAAGYASGQLATEREFKDRENQDPLRHFSRAVGGALKAWQEPEWPDSKGPFGF